MKKYYVLCMLSCLLITGNVAGQQADPFYVGTYGFTPEWDANLHKTHFVRGVTGTPSNDWERIHYLSQVQFDRARELGMNLVYPAVYPRNVADTTPGVIEQIHDAAIADHNNPLYMSVLEFTLGDYLHGERIMLHPESGNDFDQQGSYLQTQDEQFIDFPVQGARLATPLREHKAQINSIQMEHGFGVISGVNMKRKLELSMYRNYRDTSSNREGEEGSGLYIVSATVLINDPAELTNDSLPLMEVTIHTVDSSTSTPASLSFMLYESDFFDQNDQPIDVPVELILGYIEIRQDSGVVFIRERDVNNNAWLDTGLRKYAKVISNDEYHNKDSTSEKLGPIDLEISYAGDANSPAFQLDAVCLSSPRTFAMFHPDHPVVQPGGALEAWEGTRDGFLDRLDAILNDQNQNPLTNLRFLTAPEVGWRGAFWPLVKVANKLLEAASNGQVQFYGALGYSQDSASAASMNQHYALGYYGYPAGIEHDRPVYDAVDPDEYHTAINQHDKKGFTEVAIRYRLFAEERQKGSPDYPWIPFVQNHSNIFDTTPPEYDDDDPLREPTASELRYNCNIALAFGADGVMFYHLVSDPWITSDPFWPDDKQTWAADSTRPIDDDVGILGFLDEGLAPRTCDWNGENKFDSSVVYINGFLAVVGEMIKQNLIWQNGKIWHRRTQVDAGTNDWVGEVLSFRQDAADPIDVKDSTYVLISEFEHRTSNDRYLFVVNGRSHPTEGHRHITVKLAPASDPLDQWLVENVLTGDIWLVRPTDNPDTTTVANGFTDYFAPGAAALYRIFPRTTDPPDFLTDCFPHTFTVTRGAVLSLANTPVLLAHGGRIVVEDSTVFTDCQVECCDLEGKASIDVRNGGSLHLLGSSLSPANSRVSRVPIAVGPDSRLNSVYTIHNGLSGDDAAITMINGYTRTFGNAIDLSGGGRFVRMWGNGELLARFDSVQGNTASWSYGIEANGGRCYLQNVRLLNVDYGLFATNHAFIQGCDSASPKKGYNKIRANDVGMYCYDSEIFLGEAPNDWYAAHNSIGILDPTISNHATAPTGFIYAQYNFWGYGSGTPMQPCPPNVAGNVVSSQELQYDPVPFTGSDGEQTLSKTLATTALNPGNIRATVLGYLAANAQTDARDAIGNFLQSGGGLQVGTLDLAFLYRTVKQVNGQALVADILSDCLTRTDLRSKLLAADILQHEGDLVTALSVLNSYSFVASDTLMRDALLRKAVLYPLTGPGGYADGLAAIDTLAGLVAFDSTLQVFIDLYPRLFSGLSEKTQTITPKKQTFGYAEMLQPTAIELWPNYPNPFRDLTSFTFKLHEAMHVRLVVHDAMGREVAVVTDARYTRGVHSVVLRSGHLPSGRYFCRLMTDSEVIQRNMLLLR